MSADGRMALARTVAASPPPLLDVASTPVSAGPGRSEADALQAARPTRRIADIEVLRAAAVMMVLYEHAQINLVFWHSTLLTGIGTVLRGWVGVDLFFAISGFVIARGLLPILLPCTGTDAFILETVRFWLRRAWRLWPTAWLWLVIPVGLCLIFTRAGALSDARTNIAALVAGVLEVANIRDATLFNVKPVGVAFPYWSLSLEEQFYLALPLLVFVFRRWIAVPLLVLVVWQFGLGKPTPMSMMVRPGAISIGVLLALWEGTASWRLLEPRILRTSRPARIATVSILLLLLMALGSEDMMIAPFRVGLIAVLSGVLVWIASYSRGYICRDGWTRRRLWWLAERSYAIYVIHIPVYLVFHEAWSGLHPHVPPHGRVAALYVAAAIGVVLLLAWANDRLYADRLRRHGAVVAARFGNSVRP